MWMPTCTPTRPGPPPPPVYVPIPPAISTANIAAAMTSYFTGTGPQSAQPQSAQPQYVDAALSIPVTRTPGWQPSPRDPRFPKTYKPLEPTMQAPVPPSVPAKTPSPEPHSVPVQEPQSVAVSEPLPIQDARHDVAETVKGVEVDAAMDAAAAAEVPSAVTDGPTTLQDARDRFHAALQESEDDLVSAQPFGAKRTRIMYPAGDEPDAGWETVRIKHRRQEVNIIAATSSRSDKQAPASAPEVVPTAETEMPEVLLAPAPVPAPAPSPAFDPTPAAVSDDIISTGPEFPNENAVAGDFNEGNLAAAPLAQTHDVELPNTNLASVELIAAAMNMLAEQEQHADFEEVPAPAAAHAPVPAPAPAPEVEAVVGPVFALDRPRRERRAPNRFVPGARI